MKSFQGDLKRHQSLIKIGKGKKAANGLAELESKQEKRRCRAKAKSEVLHAGNG